MHNIFSYSEILDEIFSYSSKHTTTITARVCRVWFAHSIRFIWDTVDLDDAISVLSPLDIEDDGFQRLSIAQSWDRFFLYSKHVRHLKCSHLEETVLKPVILWRPCTDPFFPALTAIDWEGDEKDIDFLLPFLTPTLQHLDIYLGSLQKPVLDALCKIIVKRSPSLRVFKFEISRQRQPIVSRPLIELMFLLPRLILVVIPVHFMNKKLFAILSGLPDLKGLLLFAPRNKETDYMEKEMETRITADKKTKDSRPFQSLEDFYISDEQHFTIIKAFQYATRLSNLVCLDCSPQSETSDELMNVVGSVHVVCPNLREIILRGMLSSLRSLPWQVVQALLKCPYLHSLSVFGFNVDMELDHITTVAINRKFWRAINLHSSKPWSFQALIPFAQNCPELDELGLELDDELGLPDLGTFEPDVRFSSLTSLDVGESEVADPVGVGIFLSNICGNTLTIGFEGDDEDYACESSWKTVEKIANSIKATVAAQVQRLKRQGGSG